jgi:hypothetical protein
VAASADGGYAKSLSGTVGGIASTLASPEAKAATKIAKLIGVGSDLAGAVQSQQIMVYLIICADDTFGVGVYNLPKHRILTWDPQRNTNTTQVHKYGSWLNTNVPGNTVTGNLSEPGVGAQWEAYTPAE